MLSLTSPSASYTTQSLSSSALATSTRNSAGGCTHLAAFHKLESFFLSFALSQPKRIVINASKPLYKLANLCVSPIMIPLPLQKRTDQAPIWFDESFLPQYNLHAPVCRLETLLLESGAEGEKKSSDSHFRPAIGNGPAPYSQ